MIRIISTAVALCLASGVAMAEPVKLSDSELQNQAAGQPLLEVLTGFDVLSEFNLNVVSQIGAAVGILGSATQANVANIANAIQSSAFSQLPDVND